jgi:hypothetical protein
VITRRALSTPTTPIWIRVERRSGLMGNGLFSEYEAGPVPGKATCIAPYPRTRFAEGVANTDRMASALPCLTQPAPHATRAQSNAIATSILEPEIAAHGASEFVLTALLPHPSSSTETIPAHCEGCPVPAG